MDSRYLLVIIVPLVLFGCKREGVVSETARGGVEKSIPNIGEPVVATPPPDITRRNSLLFPRAVAQGRGGEIYVSDPKVNSVFVLNPDLKIISEFKNIASPFGLAVDSEGKIYIGSRAEKAVLIYSADGRRLGALDYRPIINPNDIEIDPAGNILVVDSAAKSIYRFYPSGNFKDKLQHIDFRFPISAAISGSGDIYVADQGTDKIHIFNSAGVWQKSWGVKLGVGESDWRGKFIRLQSINFDRRGKLHASDTLLGKIQVFEPESGEFISAYGEPDEGEEGLRLPLDFVLTSDRRALVANSDASNVIYLAASIPD